MANNRFLSVPLKSPPSRRAPIIAYINAKQQNNQQRHQRRKLIVLSLFIGIFVTLTYCWLDAAKKAAFGRRQPEFIVDDDVEREENAGEKKDAIGVPLIGEFPMGSSSKLSSRPESFSNIRPKQNAFNKQQTAADSVEIRRLIRPASVENVITYLMKLANIYPGELWTLFGKDEDAKYGKDLFGLSQLEQGMCPWTTSEVNLEWLPPKPPNSDLIALAYRNERSPSNKSPVNKPFKRGSGSIGKNKDLLMNLDDERQAMIWYEHISKAGGTTFCGLARSNMFRMGVPNYSCMPSKPGQPDGRVGSWSNDELQTYFHEKRHALVSNEWDPFPSNKLKLSGREVVTQNNSHGRNKQQNYDQLSSDGPKLLFLLTMRDPSDRLLSAYNFFAITTTSSHNPPTLGQWMNNNLGRIRNFQVGGRLAFRSNIARLNHMVWRFSGGDLPHKPTDSDKASERGKLVMDSQFPRPVTDKAVWGPPFKKAVATLSQFDLILPMDVMTKEEGQTALNRLLGWDNFGVKLRNRKKQEILEQSARNGNNSNEGKPVINQIVTAGQIRNSNARKELGEEDYKILWESNWLDNLLYLWCRAVFFTRLHCDSYIIDDT